MSDPQKLPQHALLQLASLRMILMQLTMEETLSPAGKGKKALASRMR